MHHRLAEDYERMIRVTAFSVLTSLVMPAGLGLGLLYFAALRRSASLLAHGRHWRQPIALTLARAGAAVTVLALAARLGATVLLLAFAGFIVARSIALRTARRIG
jgi:hypothetical protein